MEKGEFNLNNLELTKQKQEELRKLIREMPLGVILTVPFDKEEAHAVRTRKRLNSYGQRAAALNG